jgi:DNA-binding CsgD family transcriptional regulator
MKTISPYLPVLTSNEQKLAELLLALRSPKDISREMNATTQEVRTDVNRLLKKFQVKTPAQLTNWFGARAR